MKQWILHILFYTSLTLSLPAAAQPGNNAQPGSKRIDALKTEFITQKLDLSTDEAQKFWPVYNNYQRDMNQLFRDRRQARQEQKGPESPPPDELQFESRILELKKRYRQQFLEVLPSEKVTLLYQAEREFRERLINQLRQRRQHKP